MSVGHHKCKWGPTTTALPANTPRGRGNISGPNEKEKRNAESLAKSRQKRSTIIPLEWQAIQRHSRPTHKTHPSYHLSTPPRHSYSQTM